MRKLITTTIVTVLSLPLIFAQGLGNITGSLQSNANFFLRDSTINADQNPQYSHQLFGTESWLSLNYSNQDWGLEAGIRYDVYNNSDLINRNASFTDNGIGRWFIKKNVGNLDIEGGYIYDQIGSGIIFRSYEERALAIDNALVGIKMDYRLNDNWKVKAFAGRQKQLFDIYESVMKGGAIDGYISIGEEKPLTLVPGMGVVGKTLSDATMIQIVDGVKTYLLDDRIKPQYNTYAMSIYNTLSYGDISWYAEAAIKTKDVVFDANATKLNWTGPPSLGKLINEPGYIAYSSVSYAKNKLGVTLEGKRTEYFNFRTNPFVTLNNGAYNFLPPMTRVNTYRMTNRYNAATQEFGEQGLQVDIRYRIKRGMSLNFNAAHITDLDNNVLYQEGFVEGTFKIKRKWYIIGGLQVQKYNQRVYEFKTDIDYTFVEAITPFVDVLYKFDRKKSLRFESQYLHTEQDFGSWLFGLVEFNIAPHWSFVISDMYNAVPKKKGDDGEILDPQHFPRFDIFYTQNANRFALSYVKQVEGVVCSGGICRLEPAFSGVRFSVNSTF